TPLAPEQEAVLAFQQEEQGEAAEVPQEAAVGVPVAEAPSEAEARPVAPTIRFAEEVLPSEAEREGKKVKAKKGPDDEEAKAKKPKRAKRVVFEEEDDEFDVPVG
ncbi:MAG: hypothetical protein U1B78_03835, partial [Dehalococcoidia bacterium]|nr:hypothetical protein [Dehalococcoidia bacterium]